MEPAVKNEECFFAVKEEIKTEENVNCIYLLDNSSKGEEVKNNLKTENTFVTEVSMQNKSMTTQSNQEFFPKTEIVFCDTFPVSADNIVKQEFQNFDGENVNLPIQYSLGEQVIGRVDSLAIKNECNEDLSNTVVTSMIQEEFHAACNMTQKKAVKNIKNRVITTSNNVSKKHNTNSQDAEKYVKGAMISAPQMCKNIIGPYGNSFRSKSLKPCYSKSVKNIHSSTGRRISKKRVSSRLSTGDYSKCDLNDTFIGKKLQHECKLAHYRKQQKIDLSNKQFNIKKQTHIQSSAPTVSTYFTCDICNKSIKSKPNFSKHLLRHENIKKYICDICGKSFFQKYDLSQHIPTHPSATATKNYLCDLCTASFFRKYHLSRHKKLCHNIVGDTIVKTNGGESLGNMNFIQSASKSFICSICDKSFGSNDNLQKHLLIHKSVKNIICDKCGLLFFHKSAFQRHSLIHENIKKYSCDYCHKLFRRKSHLISHFPLHVKDITNKYNCSDCCESFKTKSVLRKHVMNH